MKKPLSALFLIVFLSTGFFADGCVVESSDYTGEVQMPVQRAVIVWDGSTEQIIIESKIAMEDVKEVAWLIPIPSSTKPVVEEADEKIFFELEELVRPPASEGSTNALQRIGGKGEVTVLEELKVDFYDLNILRATDANVLINWLNENGYSFPNGFTALLHDYVESGEFYFIVNKINLQRKYKYHKVDPTVQDFQCVQSIVEKVGMESLVKKYREKDIQRKADGGVAYKYGEVGDIQEHVERAMSHYKDCNSADPEAVAVLITVGLGIATPLKVTFTPEKPFYPMAFSSINQGNGIAKVYLIGNNPYLDKSGVLSIENMWRMQDCQERCFVTLFSWKGNYSDLGEDSFFTETDFDPKLDPAYVPLSNYLSFFWFSLLFVSGLSILVIVVPFVSGVVLQGVRKQKNKPKGFFSSSHGFVRDLTTLLLVFGLPGFGLVLILFWVASRLFFSGYVSDLGFFLLALYFVVLILLLSLLSIPYYFCLACGFLFRRSGYKKRFLAALVFVFVSLLAVVMLLFPGFPLALASV